MCCSLEIFSYHSPFRDVIRTFRFLGGFFVLIFIFVSLILPSPVQAAIPTFSVSPSESPVSTATNPINVGSNVTFSATATVSDGQNYYFAVCKTNAITAGRNSAPTCTGGAFCITSNIASGTPTSCSYTTLAGDAESNAWYGFVCNKSTSGYGCSPADQGSGNSGSPLEVNHRPAFTAVSNDGPKVSGQTLTWNTTASDPDTSSSDTTTLYVCKANDFTGTACGGGGEWCHSAASASNPTCNISAPSGNTYNAYVFAVDNHGFPASGGSQGTNSSFTTTNPTFNISGHIYAAEPSTAFNCSTNNLTLSFSINGAAPTTTTCTASDGSWGPLSVTAGAGDIFNLWVSGQGTGTVYAQTVLVSNATAKSDINLFQNTLVARNDSGTGITNANFGTGYYATKGQQMYTVSAGALSVDAGIEFHIPASSTYAPGANSSFGGSYHNLGTANWGSNTAIFTSTSVGRTLTGTMTGTSVFYNLKFNGTGGGWTAQNNLTISHVLSLDAGTFDGGSATITLTGAGMPFSITNGTFTPNQSTVSYEATTATTIADTAYYNLVFNPASGTPAFALPTASTGTSVLNSSSKVQTGTVSFTTTEGTKTVTLPTTLADTSKAFLMFNYNTTNTNTDADPACQRIGGELTSTTTLTFSRYSSSCANDTISLRWYVAEFSSGVTVQRGSVNLLNINNTTVTISAVDLSKTFVLLSQYDGGTAIMRDDFVKAKLTSTTQLYIGCSTGGYSTVNPIIYWQVIQFDDATVQQMDAQIGSTSLSVTSDVATPLSDISKAALIFNYNSSDTSGSSQGRNMIRGVITDSNTMTFDRSETGTTIDITYYLVQFNNTNVKTGTASFATTETSKTGNISTIATDQSMPFAAGGFYHMGGKTSQVTANGDNITAGLVKMDITNSTTLTITRAGYVVPTADITWFAMEFPLPVHTTAGALTIAHDLTIQGTGAATVDLSSKPVNITGSLTIGSNGTFLAPNGQPLPSSLADSWDMSNNTGSYSQSGSQGKLGQSFTATTGILTQATFYLTRSISSGGNLTAALYAMTGTYGTTSKPTGSALATSDVISGAGLSGTMQPFTFTFTGANQIALTNGMKYIIVIQTDYANGVNVAATLTSSGVNHSGNESYYSNGLWTSNNSQDLNFYVYESPELNNLTIGGDFTNNGTFTHNNGTVIFDDATQTSHLTYTADTTFYNISVPSSAVGKHLQFDESQTTIIASGGSLSIQGVDCDTGRIYLDSFVNDNQWALTTTGATVDIDYTDIEDSYATNPISAENSTAQNDNNTNWTITSAGCTTQDVFLTSQSDGVSAGQTIDGIVVNKVTTVASIPFDNVASNQVMYAAQQFRVTTNSSAGYTVTVNLKEPLMGTNPVNLINGFAAPGTTWLTPQPWTSPTGTNPSSNTGWLGAHTSDVRVNGWSNANGKFGPVDTTPRTIMYSDIADPAGTIAYVIYAFEVNQNQPVDTYNATVVYNVMPIY